MQQQADMIAQSLERTLGPRMAAGSASTSSGGSGSNVNMSGVKTAVDGFIGSLDRVSKGASATGMVLEGVAAGLSKLPLPGLGAAFGAVSGKVTEATGVMQSMADKGALAGGRMTELATGIAGSGGNAQAFMATMENYRKNLQGVSATTGEGQVNMGKFFTEFRQTDVGLKLRGMGMSMDQINQVAAVSLANSQYKDIADDKSRKKAIAGTEEFAAKLLFATETTGKNTQTILAENVARSESNDVMGEIMLGGPEMQEAYSRLQKSTMDMSPAMQGMVDEMFATGVKSEETAAKMSALGAAGVDLEKAATMQRNAKSEGEKKEADMAMARAKANADQYMKSEQFIRTMQNDKTSEVGRAANQLYQENKARLAGQQIAAGRNVAEGRAGDTGTAVRRQQAQVGAEINMRDMKTGEKTPGAATFEAMQKADMSAQAAANQLVISGFNKVGPAADRLAEGLTKSLNKLPMAPGATPATPPVGPAGGSVRTQERPRSNGSPGMEQLASTMKGQWSSVLENFDPKGTTVTTHGKEVIVNEKQWMAIGDVIQNKLNPKTPEGGGKGAGNNIDSLLASVQKSTADNKMPQVDSKQIEGMSANFAKSMPDLSSKMADMTKSAFNPEKMSTMGTDMFKGMNKSMPDMFKSMSNIKMPDPTSMLGGLKGNFNSLTSELSTNKATKETASNKEEALPSPTNVPAMPNQDALTSMLEKLNSGISNVGGLLQAGNDIASSTSSKMDMDNRFAI